MIQTISEPDFKDAFRAYKRDDFSREGLKALFSYLEDYEDATGEQIELDVITLCCEFAEYENLAEFQKDYGEDEYPDMDSIEECTQVINIDDTKFIIQSF